MTSAAELREALAEEAKKQVWFPNERVIFAAARERLAQLEADPELVERIASTLYRHYEEESGIPEDAPQWRIAARVILAAISTPTPVEAE